MTNSDPRPLLRIFSPFFPFPGFGGSEQIMIGDMHNRLKDYRVELVCWNSTDEDVAKLSAIPTIDPVRPDIKVVLLKSEFRKPRLKRVFESLFSKYSSTELYYYPNLVEVPELERADLEIYHYSFALNWLEQGYFPRARKRVCYYHNIEAELIRQRTEAEPNFFKRKILERNAKLLLANESKISSLVDEVWFVSAADLKFAKTRFGMKNGVLVTPGFSDKFKSARSKLRATRARTGPYTVGLLGALDYKPNADSALFILEEVCPKIAEANADCRFVIAGKNPSTRQKELASKYSFVELPGFVKDIESYWASLDCMTIPHITGSGIRIKMLEALESNVPVIADPAAAAALPAEYQSEYLSVIALDDFANEIIRRSRLPRS